MNNLVIIGNGKPRIVVVSATVLTNTVASVDTSLNVVYLTTAALLSADLLNRMFVGKNSSNQDTQGKITGYDNDVDCIICEGFDNGFPVATGSAIVKNYVIDMPYSKEIIETFEPVFSPPKTLYHNRKKVRKLMGFYYYASIDYSNYSKRSMIAPLAKVYDASRTSSLIFYPRVDNKTIYYEAEINPEEAFNIAQIIKNQGHRYVKISLEGLPLLTRIPLDVSLDDLAPYQYVVTDEAYLIEEFK